MAGSLTEPPPHTATAVRERALAPDLARGIMLLLVAVANVPAFLYGRALDPAGLPAAKTPLEDVLAFIEVDLLVTRGWPMFAALYGYGMVQLLNRRTARGAEPAAGYRLLRHRGLWIILFGLIHAALLWSGDILGVYGLIALLFAKPLLRVRARVLPAIAIVSTLVVGLGGAVQNLAPGTTKTSPLASTGETDLLLAAVHRLEEWSAFVLTLPLGVVGAVALGVWAARRRLLEEPARHRRLLRGIAITGVTVSVLGGLPQAMLVSGLWTSESEATRMVAGALHFASGYGGIGYAALVCLIVLRIGTRPGRVMNAITAGGRRSLTCYVAQSVIFVAALASYGGGLGEHVGLATATGIAVATWAITMVAAELMRRTEYRGPLEIVLRRLTYRQGPG